MNELNNSLLDTFELHDKPFKERMRVAFQFYENKQYEFAHQVIEHSIKDQPFNHHAHFLLGLTLLNLNRTSEAEESFKRVIESSPESVQAHFQISLIMFSRGEVSNAVHHMSQAIALTKPGSHAIGRRFFLRGIMRMISQDRDGLDDLREANVSGFDCSETIEIFENNDCQDCFKDEF